MFKINYKSLYDELDELGIEVYDYDLKTCNALTVLVDGKYYIGINKNKDFSEMMKFWLIQHELEHIKHGTFYHMNDDKFIINKNERITNDAVITKLGIITPILESMYKGANKWEICSYYDLPFEIYDYCIDYIKRKGLTTMKNCVDLLCHKRGYDAQVLAYKLGCTKEEAQDIMNEKTFIKYEYIMRLCQIFQVSEEYLLCI